MDGYAYFEQHHEDLRRLVCLMQEEAVSPGQQYEQERNAVRRREKASEILLPALYLKEKLVLPEFLYELMVMAYVYESDGSLCLDYQTKSGQRVPDFQYGLHLLSCCTEVDTSLLPALCDPESLLWVLFERQDVPETPLLCHKMLLKKEIIYFLSTSFILLPDGVTCYPAEETAWFPVHEPIWRRLYALSGGAPFLCAVMLCGRKGSGRKSLIRRLGQEKGKAVLYFKARRLCREPEEMQRRTTSALRLACALMPFLLAIDCERMEGAEETAWLEEWTDRFGNRRKSSAGYQRTDQETGRETGGEIYFLAESGREAEAPAGIAGITLYLRDFLSQEELGAVLAWYREKGILTGEEEQIFLRYRFSIGELLDKLALLRMEGKGEEESRLRRVLKSTSPRQTMGELIDTPCSMEEYVGSPENRELLQRLIQISAGWQDTVGRWNEEGRSFREGLVLLFYGASGTGKTMSASILATELSMALFKINLSEIFDKYIGETEKHLEEILRMAESNNYILFFDEADALFARRTQVNDSHDKYANLSTSYLLQRLERYPGIVVLATNLIQNFDDAFLRRIRFVIKFQPLDAMQRASLWKQVLHKADGIAEDISIPELAEKVDLSPARIKEAALTAMVLARQEGDGRVTREQLLWAIRAEAGKDETTVGL